MGLKLGMLMFYHDTGCRTLIGEVCIAILYVFSAPAFFVEGQDEFHLIIKTELVIFYHCICIFFKSDLKKAVQQLQGKIIF